MMEEKYVLLMLKWEWTVPIYLLISGGVIWASLHCP